MKRNKENVGLFFAILNLFHLYNLLSSSGVSLFGNLDSLFTPDWAKNVLPLLCLAGIIIGMKMFSSKIKFWLGILLSIKILIVSVFLKYMLLI